MGRWLKTAREAEKKSETLEGATDETDKTPSKEVLSVLSVRRMSVSEKFSGHRCACGRVGIVADGWFLRDQSRAKWACSECFRRDREARK